MTTIDRIANGLADNLLKDAAVPADPARLIENAFLRGLQLGLTLRQTDRRMVPVGRPAAREAPHGA